MGAAAFDDPFYVEIAHRAGNWRWKVRSTGNHEIVAASTEGYKNRRHAIGNFELITGIKLDARARQRKNWKVFQQGVDFKMREAYQSMVEKVTIR